MQNDYIDYSPTRNAKRLIEDLRGFMARVESKQPDEFVRVKEEVSSRYEVTAAVMELEKARRYPMLYFEKVNDRTIPVVVNVLPTYERIAFAMNTTRENLFQEWLRREANLISPKIVNNAPVKEVILRDNQVDLGKLPIPTHFAQDGGPYITGGVYVAKDSDTGARNASLHRIHVKDRNKCGTSLHSRRTLWYFQKKAEEKGKPLEVAVVIGPEPLTLLGSLWMGPTGTDEFAVTGGLAGEPLELVKGETVDVEYPARAEIVLEGEILPNVREPEGPLVEYTGYASHSSTKNVLKVKAICHRRNPVYEDLTPGFSAEHEVLTSMIVGPSVYQAVKEVVPTVKAVHHPLSVPAGFHTYISIKKIAEGQAKQAIFAAFAADHWTKLVVVVDDDIDVYNEQEVLWAIATRMQADDDLFVVPGVMDGILDPSSKDGVSAKVGIDATMPLKGWIAERGTVPPEAVDSIRRKMPKN